MDARMPVRRDHAAAAVVAAGAVLAGLAAGCSRPAAAPRGSVESCVQFGVQAIRHHVTVTSLPPACRGLTRAQVNSAVGGALHAAAIGVRGKAHQRERIAATSHFLKRLVNAVPQQPSQPSVPAPVPAHQASRTGLALAAASTWVVTFVLGLRMLARWIARGRPRRGPARHPRRPPALNLAHFGLATTGLLAWIVYLVTGVTAVAWAACALLPAVAGLGMTLVFLPASRGTAESAVAAQAGVPIREDPPRLRRPPVLAVGAHVAFATTTILLAFLAAIGTG